MPPLTVPNRRLEVSAIKVVLGIVLEPGNGIVVERLGRVGRIRYDSVRVICIVRVIGLPSALTTETDLRPSWSARCQEVYHSCPSCIDKQSRARCLARLADLHRGQSSSVPSDR